MEKLLNYLMQDIKWIEQRWNLAYIEASWVTKLYQWD